MMTKSRYEVTLEMRMDELGDFTRQMGETAILLQANERELRQTASDLRFQKRVKAGEFILRGIERKRRHLTYTRKCLLAKLELLEADNEEKRRELLELQS